MPLRSRVQCPNNTITHPSTLNNNDAEPAYISPTTFALGSNGYQVPSANVNGAIKCQQISGGDGYATMADGTQTFMFSFGPLSGLAKMADGQPGTDFPGDSIRCTRALYSPAIRPASDGITVNTPGLGSPVANL